VLKLPLAALKELSLSAPAAIEAALAKERAALERQRRVLRADPAKQTRLVVNDLERLESAGSLLSIDLDRCTRCGHCARACADTHGESRLLRQGEKVLATLRSDSEPRKTALLFPTACQHCHEPACLVACPTGAIVREPSGAVLIREELCTGCGACATACPWDAVRMSVRGAGAAPARIAGVVSAAVATKCDSCHGRDAPACVEACPTSAIFRLSPKRDVLEIFALSLGVEANARARSVRSSTPSPARGMSPASWIARAAVLPPLAAAFFWAFERGGVSVRAFGGVAAGFLVLFLAAQSLVKRHARTRSRVARVLLRARPRSVVRPLLALHSLLGVFAVGFALVHTGFRFPSGIAGLLSFAFYASAFTGALGALLYRTLPSRITRLERSVTLPEDAARELERLFDRLYAETTGQNLARKQLLFGVLIPYVRSWTGACLLVLSGRSLAEEGARLAGCIESLLAGRVSSRLSGAASLLDTAVAMRAAKAKRLLEWIVGAFVPLHLALALLTLVLLLAHGVGASL
jgi:Fe-S-cluster-containing dehydrogenase component